MEIEQEILNLSGKRGEKRQQAIRRVSLNFMQFLKVGGYTRFSKSLFNSFIPEHLNERTSRKISKELLSFLTLENKIKPIKETKTYTLLKNKPLSSMDKGSYSALMRANGYKVNYYVYENKDGYPQKVKVGQSAINETVNFDYDLSELSTTKPQSRQGVYTNSALSVIKKYEHRTVKMFEVLE